MKVLEKNASVGGFCGKGSLQETFFKKKCWRGVRPWVDTKGSKFLSIGGGCRYLPKFLSEKM